MTKPADPVRYDAKGRCIRHGDLGSVLIEMPDRWGTDKDAQRHIDAETHERGEYIAKCINKHQSLIEENERLREALARILNAWPKERPRELVEFAKLAGQCKTIAQAALDSPTGRE